MRFCSGRSLGLALVGATLAFATTANGAVFTEDFGTLANATTISTANTNLTYVRVGSAGGSITATNPSTVGTGASATIAGPTTTSLNGIGVQSTLGLTSQADLSFDLKFGNATTGTL